MTEISKYGNPGATIKKETLFLQTNYEDNFWEIDTIKIKSVISQLKQQQITLNAMMKNFIEEIVPPLVPWIIKRWEELNPETQVYLLTDLKTPLNVLVNNYKKVSGLNESSMEYLGVVVTGYETDYLTDISNTSGIISSEENASDKKNEKENTKNNTNKWILIPDGKIKGDIGRLDMNFPIGVDWNIWIYRQSDNKMINSFYPGNKIKTYNLPPAVYRIMFNNVPIENLTIEKGRATKLRFGFLNIASAVDWSLQDDARQTIYISNTTVQKVAVPVGSYQLKFGDKYYRVVIKDKATIKFELPVQFD